MANTSRSRSGSSRSSKSSTAKRTSRSNSTRSGSTRSNASRSASRRTEVPQETGSGFADAFKKFASTRAAMPLIFLGAVLLIVGLDLLISWNKYEMFFKILGIEVLLAVIVWVVLTLFFSGKNMMKSEPGSKQVEIQCLKPA